MDTESSAQQQTASSEQELQIVLREQVLIVRDQEGEVIPIKDHASKEDPYHPE